MTGPGIFRRLLGSGFERLAPRLREVHGGATLELRGTATVTRGSSLLGRIVGSLASLPEAQRDSPVRVSLVVDERGETWTRYFGASRPMRSRLRARDGLLVERLGPVELGFRLHERAGAIAWEVESASLLGIPAPRRWLAATTARSFERDGRYCFEVEVALPLIGHLVGYRGSTGIGN